MSNGIEIDEEQFEKLSSNEQLTILFRNTKKIITIQETKEHTCAAQIASCSAKFDKMNKRKIIDKGDGLYSFEYGRDLGASISMLTRAVQQLKEKLDYATAKYA